MQGTLRTWGLAGLAAAACALGPAITPAESAGKTARFNVTTVQKATGGNVTVTSQVWITQTQARIELKHPLQGNSTWLVTGGNLYQFNHRTKQGIRIPLPDKIKKSKDNFDFLISRFAFDARGVLKSGKKLRTENAAGYLCDVVKSSETKGEASRSVMVWVPQKMQPKFPVKAVVEMKVTKPGANLSESISVALSNIKLNGAIPASTFTLPKGYKIQDVPAGAGAPARK
ncbi:MAG: hypothetical protein ACK47B_29100 [Armatimonadota bacterium]